MYTEKKFDFDIKMINRVEVFHSNIVRGFRFLDKNFKILYEIGDTLNKKNNHT